jgi:hypothetical protein
MSTPNAMSEDRIHEALVDLERMWTRVKQDDERAGSAATATPPSQHPEAPTRRERLTEGAQREDEGAGAAPSATSPNSTRSAPTAPPPNQDPEARARLECLVQRAQQGDEGALAELRRVLDAHPDFWQRYGDLALQAQAAWLHLISGQNVLLREALQRKLDQLKAELAGTDPSPLEKLLVERATATWLQLQYADAAYAQAKVNSSSAQHQSIQRRQNSAQQRHFQAVKMLVTVRKLLSPAQATGESQPRLFTPAAVG